MTSNEKAPSFYLLIRQREDRNIDFTLATDKENAKKRMEEEGFRAFELTHERFVEDLTE